MTSQKSDKPNCHTILKLEKMSPLELENMSPLELEKMFPYDFRFRRKQNLDPHLVIKAIPLRDLSLQAEFPVTLCFELKEGGLFQAATKVLEHFEPTLEQKTLKQLENIEKSLRDIEELLVKCLEEKL